MLRRLLQRIMAGEGGNCGVAPGVQVNLQGAEDLNFIIYDQYRCHGVLS
jgi:hypothetical protein